ncbi:TIGR01777 family oxidoreductase [Zunongwangia sp. H14]|uniref:TIGR01777 family oxidoreductase n=1 Tax=Zunongwangia sp. H14 TaxID=3240792 RepID=UPI003561E1C5
MRVLITGATGLIGSEISRRCQEKDIDVHYLTTSKSKIEKKEQYKGFYWNPSKGEIDLNALEGVSAIINLVGASIAKPWTEKNKKIILNSRIESAMLLFDTLSKNKHSIDQFISASAIGIYPSSKEKLYAEDDTGVDDSFVGKVVVKWESAVNNFQDLGIDVAKLRIGLVLAENGGMLEKLKQPVGFNAGAPLGDGKQWQSWIHIEDLANIFIHALENELAGTYNAVAPNPVTNKELVKCVAKTMGKSVWLPNVPAVVLKTLLGEMSTILLSSQLVSNNKIESTGFSFKFTHLSNALQDLLK